MPAEDKIQTLIFGGIMATLAAMVTAMLSKEGNVWDRVKTFIAGVCCGILATWLLSNIQLSEPLKNIITIASSAFVSSFWPMLGKMWTSGVEKYIKKKSDAHFPNS